MITFLHGILIESWPNRLVVDVNGIGYEVWIPLGAGEALGQMGDRVRVLTHQHIREQEHTLYGFATEDQRDLFRLLINRVSGVGPKVAMSILGGMSAADFKAAVVAGDIALLARIKGLGKKTAERVVLELKDKVGVAEAWEAQTRAISLSPEQSAQNDVVLALISLGYKQADAQKAAAAAAKAGTGSTDADGLLRAALRLLQ